MNRLLPRAVQPLGRKLSVLISALLAAALFTFALLAYARMREALLAVAETRMVSASAQFAGLLDASSRQLRQGAAVLAARSEVVEALARPTPTSLARAGAVLARATTAAAAPQQPVRSLWDRECRRVLPPAPLAAAPAAGGCPVATQPAGAPPFTRAWLGPFVASGDSIRYSVVAPVVTAERDTLGFLVEEQPLAARGAAEVAGLIGRDAALRVGNADGSLWTNLERRTDGPPTDAPRGMLAQRVDAEGIAHLGVARDIAGSAWTAWVEVPSAVALAPGRKLLDDLARIALLCIGGGALGAWILGRHVAAPIREIVDAAGTLATGNYARRVTIDRGDELGTLASAFNGMAERIESAADELQEHYQQATSLATELELANQELMESMDETSVARHEKEQVRLELVQAQKMEAVGRLAGGIAHDFNNILTVITTCSSLALESLRDDDAARDDLLEIRTAAHRAAGLTRQLLAFSRKQVLQARVVNLNELARDMKRMLQRLIGEDVALTLDLDPALGEVFTDPGQLEQVILNLVVNARDAMPNGGQLTIATANHSGSREQAIGAPGATAGDYVTVTVTDSGVGMPPDVQAHLFEPFFTTKPAGMGTGLGLSTVYGIVRQSSGDIHVDSAPGEGTTVRIILPRHHEPTDPPPSDATPPLGRTSGTEMVLLLEDNDALRSLARRILDRAGYRVLEASTPEAALRLAADHGEPIDLLVTDVVLPGMNGREVAEQLAQLRPSLRVLYMSGYTDDDVMRRGIQASSVRFLDKPFGADELTRAVREALDDGPGGGPGGGAAASQLRPPPSGGLARAGRTAG